MDQLICGAFHSDIAPAWAKQAAEDGQRIFARNPDGGKAPPFFPVGVDESQVFDGQHQHDRFSFFSQFSSRATIITLSQQEKQLLITSGMIQPDRLLCFEEIYPFFADIKFVNNAQKNHALLLRRLQDVSRLKIKGGATDYWSRKFLYKVARKINKRSALDAGFAHASSLAYQEAFKLVEARPQRRIIALDFNSMYGACMDGEFADPAHLLHQQINQYYQPGTPLSCGLYRVRLSHATSAFIRDYHALKYACLNKKFAFALTDNQQVEVLLHSNEIEYYARHFAEVYLCEGICSTKSIAHPLFRDAQRTYAQRLHYKRQGNSTLERVCKLQLATMYGAVKRRKYHTATFPDFAATHQFLQENFGLSCPDALQPDEFLRRLSDGHRFTIKASREISIRYLTHHANTLLFSLYSQVIANARVKMMHAIEFMRQFPGLEVCYCNIDSLHISLPADSIDAFYRYAAPLIGEEMGKLKTEIQADRGYWFEPGRYWLIRDNQVVLFKNQGVHNPYADDPFQDGRSYYKTYQEGDYTIPIKCRRDIAGTLTYNKKLAGTDQAEHIVFNRYQVAEVADVSAIQRTVLQEVERSAAVKMALFEQLAARYR